MEDIKQQRRREYIKEYKKNRREDNLDYENALANSYNRISYYRKKGIVDNDLYDSVKILYPSFYSIRNELQTIKLLDKNGSAKEQLLKMIQDILG